ncbi:MAG: hypothetical protein N3D84_02755 [Candidatus Woesearchaeota archaeon]|nr:hypothetical protein [Candidatus Woesearchaeota archaeon]
MWPFKKKIKPDYKKLVEEDKELMSEEEIEKADEEFREESGFIITRLLKKVKKL